MTPAQLHGHTPDPLPGMRPRECMPFVEVIALKAQWAVRAGLLPDEPMDEYSKAWVYTSADYARDGSTQEGMRAAGSRYTQQCTAAHRYARELEAGGLNWVAVHYVWL